MNINKIAKVIHEMRCSLGYATPEQRTEGKEGELKSVESFLKYARKNGFCSCGGFNYTKLKSGNIKITPDFSFIVKMKGGVNGK